MSIYQSKLNNVERNIIVGSLLGDGSLGLYGRSINAHYREHGCNKQISYRKWKVEKLSRLGFKFYKNSKTGKIASPSNELFTNLYNIFYKEGRKIITKENIKLLDHPIGLACLYMDDGSLIIDTFRKKNKIYLFPRVVIYSLNITKEENIILSNHIKQTFDIEFKLKERPDGYNYILEIGKRNEVIRFLDLVKFYIQEIPSMNYKIEVEESIKRKKNKFLDKYPDKEIIITSLNIVDNTYSNEEEGLIIKLKEQGVTDKEIAKKINRSYWGTVDKIRRLRKEGKL